ncbi:hypothetical protein ACLMJK_005364 [Lecanora helva]
MPGQAPKIRNFYGGGWSKQKKDISKCFECGKIKTTKIAFSEKQQNDLRHGIASRQVSVGDNFKGWITCRTCVGVQKHEMVCVVCDTVKGLEGFAKAQRRDPDNARCMTCIADVANETPVDKKTGAVDDDQDDEDSDSDSESNIYGSNIDDTDDLEASNHGVPLPPHLRTENQDPRSSRDSRTPASTARNSATASRTSSVAGSSRPSYANIAGWQNMSRENASGTGNSTAYDSKGNAFQKTFSSTASTVSDDSEATTTEPVKEARANRSNFAKVPAVQRKAVAPEYHGGKTVNYDSESDDDDDDEDGDGYFVL